MEQDEIIERSFQTSGRPTIEVSNICGSIGVIGKDVPQVSIRATRRARNDQEFELTRVEMGQDGDRIWAKTSVAKDVGAWAKWRQRPDDVWYVIECPRDSDVSINGVACSLEVSNVHGSVRTNAVSGRTSIADIDGVAAMNSVSGDVSADRIHGQVSAKSVSGRVDVANCMVEELRANSVSGSIRMETRTPLLQGASVSTVSGTCDLAIPNDMPATITTHSVSGAVYCSLPAQILETKRNRWRAHLRGGGPAITFNSVSGSLRVRGIDADAQANDATKPSGQSQEPMTQDQPQTESTRPQDHVSTASRSESTRILRAIQRRELTVDEGLRLLTAAAEQGKGEIHSA